MKKLLLFLVLFTNICLSQSIYKEDFGTSINVSLPYIYGTNPTSGFAYKDTKITSPVWTQNLSAAGFVGSSGINLTGSAATNGGNSGCMSSTIPAIGGSSIITCGFNIASGYKLIPYSVSYQYRISLGGPQKLDISITGTSGVNNITQVTTSRTAAFILQTSSNFITNNSITGDVILKFIFSNSTLNNSTSRLDNVFINGYIVPNSCTSITIWDGTNWSNGIPTTTSTAVINADYNAGSFDACSVIVNSGKTLTINDSQYVNIQNDLTNNGTVNVLNNGSLIQVNDNGVNTGNITYNRNVNSLYGYDYIYWSSPVIGQTFTNLYSIPTMGFIYQWNPTFNNTNGTQGNWESLTPTTPMTKGKGYIIRASSSYGWTGNLTSVFTGVPNNGNITIPIQRGNLSGQDDNYNLIGNPYPSAISAESFLTTNTNIQGFVYLWTHGTAPSSTISSPFYSTFQYNYTSNDYITYNGTATTNGPNGFNGDIASGQGFFVVMNDGTASTESILFNNDMRNTNNSQFYRQNNQKSRIWIDLVDSSLQSNRMVVGYVDGATNNKDRLYDAVTTTSNKFYSLINNEPHIIQGRSLPFKKNDKVKLGINITTSGVYKIAIAELDGVFNTRDIYLEDKLLNITYDLKSNPYTFTSNVGVFNNRFVLKYKTNNNNDNKVNNNIKKVSVYDMMGVKVFEGDNEAYKNMVPVRNHIYIVKTEMEDGLVIIKKISGL